jgi:general nucleoside transport system ATP-binding protein
VVILDVPSAVLAPREVESLLALLRTLAAEGRSIILVAHKLDEVLSVADRVTVLRDGRTVLEAARSDVDAPRLVAAMVGSTGTAEAAEVQLEPTAHDARPESVGPGHDVVARLQGVSVRGTRGEMALKGVDLEIRRGEIVGVAGVEGNGQAELAQVVAGRRAPDEGTATLPDEPGFIPQDRTNEGLIADFTITENVALNSQRRAEYRSGPLLRWAAIRERAWDLIRTYSLRAPSPDAQARALSGGNQQRVVVAREVAAGPELLVAENPTRGVDVTAAAFVHRQLEQMDNAGVLLISTDLDEVLRLSDRVLVITRGRLLSVPSDNRTREEVGRMMLAAGDAVTTTGQVQS